MRSLCRTVIIGISHRQIFLKDSLLVDSRISHSCSHFGKILVTRGVTLVLFIFIFFTIWLSNHVTDDVIKNFSVDHFIPRWPWKIFILTRCSILHKQFWHHNEGTYDVITSTHIPHEEYLLCAKFQFFSLVQFQRYRGPKFFHFPTWLPHHVTYDIIIISKIFYLSSRSNGDTFVSIGQAVAMKNIKVMCRQTNKQTNRQTNEPKCNTLSIDEGNHFTYWQNNEVPHL